MIKTALTKTEILELLETRKNDAWENMKLFNDSPNIYDIYHREWFEASSILGQIELQGKKKRGTKR